MDNNSYKFKIDYSSGLRVEAHDLTTPGTKFRVKIFIKKSKINSKLQWGLNQSGGRYIEEEFINNENFTIHWNEFLVGDNEYFQLHNKMFVPYNVEIYNTITNELVYSESFDPRHKLINFTLHSTSPETLHTWACVIGRFKKENNCQISITNDYLKENQKYDFVDAYFSPEENFQRYYAGYEIGRFGDENIPDFSKNPDGIKGKNDLEIIEDILYHYTKNL